jgi:hypothetical protein
MEIGAIFILVILLGVIGVIGVGVFLIAARLRGKQLSPEGDLAEHPHDGNAEHRPEHVKVESEQQTHFVGSR